MSTLDSIINKIKADNETPISIDGLDFYRGNVTLIDNNPDFKEWK